MKKRTQSTAILASSLWMPLSLMGTEIVSNKGLC